MITKLLQQPLLTWKEIIILVDYLMWQLQYHLCRSAWRWYVALVGGLEVFHFHHHNVHGKIHCSFTRFFFSEILNIDEGWYIPTKELYILYMYINTKGILYWNWYWTTWNIPSNIQKVKLPCWWNLKILSHTIPSRLIVHIISSTHLWSIYFCYDIYYLIHVSIYMFVISVRLYIGLFVPLVHCFLSEICI